MKVYYSDMFWNCSWFFEVFMPQTEYGSEV